MNEIEKVLDSNIDVVNELINAAFRQGYGTMDVGPAIASAIATYATQAIFARTATYAQMSQLGVSPRTPKNDEPT